MRPELAKGGEVAGGVGGFPEGFDPNSRIEPVDANVPSEVPSADIDLAKVDASDVPTDMAQDVGGGAAADVPEAGASAGPAAERDATERGAESDSLESADDLDSPSPREASDGLKESEGAFDEKRGRVDELFSKLEDFLASTRDRLDSHEWDWVDKLYTDVSNRIQRACYTVGEWLGEPGNSRIKPALDTPLGRAAFEKLQEFGESSIRYVKGIPDFSRCAMESVQIEGMSSVRIPDNYRLAFNALAQKLNETRPLDNGEKWTASAAKQWAKDNALSPHECSDMRTVQFVPTVIHDYFKHYGGVAEFKALERMSGVDSKTGGGFDD